MTNSSISFFISGSDGIPEELVQERLAKHQAMQSKNGRPQQITEAQYDDYEQQAQLYAKSQSGQNFQHNQLVVNHREGRWADSDNPGGRITPRVQVFEK